jgi:sigma-B regulation protein RsbU (phosphoserine phosphatase)
LILKTAGREWEPLEIEFCWEDMPLGIDETGRYTQLDVPVQIGDMVLCYTDGVIESLNSEGQQLGIGGLQRILNALPAHSPERLLTELVEQITPSSGSRFHEDDVTMLLYRVTNRPVRMRDNLAAPFRWLKGWLMNG